MKLKPNDLAPEISTADVYGNNVTLSAYKGKKVLLSFHRFVGCPVCNLRVHAYEQLKDSGIAIINVYESKPDRMRKYLQDSPLTTTFIADRSGQLYKRFGVEKSWWQFITGFLKEGMFKGLKGMKLFNGGVKGMPMPDSTFSRIPADFIIDEQGNIIEAHYGKHFADELSIEKIKAYLN